MVKEYFSQKSKSKYQNKKFVVDNIKFDSKMEGYVYLKIKELKEEYGHLFDYELQPKVELVQEFDLENKKIRAITYTGDFKIINFGFRPIVTKMYIIDVKGFTTDVFKLKAKMFAWRYKQEIVVVKSVREFEEWFMKTIAFANH